MPSFKFSYLFVIILLSFFISTHVYSQNERNDSILVLHQNLKRNLALGLKYLDSTQIKVTIPNHSYRGEWQTYMGLRVSFFLLGTGKQVDDSNCFSVASIHNALAQIYILFPEYDNIPHMLDLSFEKVMSYRNGDKFNFWNLLPPNRKLKNSDVKGSQPLVRRPTNYKLKSRYINNAANVTEDADDTGLAYTAIALRKEIQKRDHKTEPLNFELSPISPVFDKYRDINRNNYHWYNYLYGKDRETGAYLTWLGEEYQFDNWNIIKVIGHNVTFFLPFSECFPHAYQPYIPYGTNDLDAVVNANVLYTLSVYHELNSEGVMCAIKYIEKKSKTKDYDRVGTYYSNRYQFPYAVSKVYASGINQLGVSSGYLLEYLLERQNKDGSWDARRAINKKDKIQSTAYALNALINFGNFEQKNTAKPIEKSIQYLLDNAINDKNGVHWKGGVFFSGGTVVRKTLFWKSDAYTTAIILNAFANYIKYIEEKYDIVGLEKQ